MRVLAKKRYRWEMNADNDVVGTSYHVFFSALKASRKRFFLLLRFLFESLKRSFSFFEKFPHSFSSDCLCPFLFVVFIRRVLGSATSEGSPSPAIIIVCMVLPTF